MEVDAVAVSFRQKDCCIMLCIFKAILFALVAVFVLYLPLGDPSSYCTVAAEHSKRHEGMCCLCNIYLMVVRVASKTTKLSLGMIYAVGDLLHEAKLKFYSVLEKIDRDDLCRSICCSDSMDLSDVKKERKHPPCRCSSKKCIKKSE